MTKLISITVTAAAIQLIYSGFIVGMGESLPHAIDAMNAYYTFLPSDPVRSAISMHPFITAMAANIYLFIHMVIYSVIAYGVVFSIFARKAQFSPPGLNEMIDRSSFKGREYKDVKHITSVMLYGDSEQFLLEDISPKDVVRIDRKQLENVPNATTPAQKLTIAGLEMLNAHRNVPAAISGHHGGKSLYDHTINVMIEYVRLTNKHKLAEAIAVFHDIGKLLVYSEKSSKIPLKRNHSSYQKLIIKHFPQSTQARELKRRKFRIEKVWEKETNNHEATALTILYATPEFWDLSEVDQATLKAVLKYKKGALPLKFTDDKEVKTLITNLSIADGQALKHEVNHSYKDAKKSVEGFDAAVDQVVLDALAGANINNHQKKKNGDGWSFVDEDRFYVLCSSLQNSIAELAGPEITKTLALDVPYKKNVFSPFRSMLIQSLDRQGLLIHEINDIGSNQGIYDLKVGKMPFYEVVIINTSALKQLSRLPIPEWGNSPYTIRVVESLADWSPVDFSDDSEDALSTNDILKAGLGSMESDSKLLLAAIGND